LPLFGSHRRGDQVDLQRACHLHAKNTMVSPGLAFSF
jgi:hypothetical protein